MRREMILNLRVVLLISVLAMSGCLPGTRQATTIPRKETVHIALFPPEVIDQKIVALNTILKKKELSDADKIMVRQLLSLYKAVGDAVVETPVNTEHKKITKALFDQLTQMDEEYFLKRPRDMDQSARAIKEFSNRRQKILDAYLAEDYEGVIRQCIELEATLGPESLTPDIGLPFAFSLAKKGMHEEAISIGERVSRELEGKPDLIDLRALVIGWELDRGEKDRAMLNYEKLIDNLEERKALLAGVKKRISTERTKNVNLKPDDHSAETIQGTGIQAKGPLEEVLRQVEDLIQQHAYRKARLLLIRTRIRFSEGPETEIIDQALRSVEVAEQTFFKMQESDIPLDEKTLGLAQRLIEEERYQEALLELGLLRKDQDPETNSERKRLEEQAIEKLVMRERNKAAKLFLMAKETEDAQKKGDLLLASYKILKALVDKYPSSLLNKKINNNLSIVKEELRKLGVSPG
ncbi:hypothetical protein ACFL9T_04455 [Thermodesulfobacteriota bacterium]